MAPLSAPRSTAYAASDDVAGSRLRRRHSSVIVLLLLVFIHFGRVVTLVHVSRFASCRRFSDSPVVDNCRPHHLNEHHISH